MKELGAGRSIVIDKHGQIIARNGVIENASKAVITEVDVLQSDGTKIIAIQRVDPKARQLAIADNRTAELAEWNPEVLAELATDLRLAWTKDKEIIAATIAQIVQLEYSLIHELEGVPLVLEESVSAPVEILLLLNHADGNRLQKEMLCAQAKNNTPQAVDTAVSRLLKANEIRSTGTPGELAAHSERQKRMIEKIIPSLRSEFVAFVVPGS